jgi:hypothetical protein
MEKESTPPPQTPPLTRRLPQQTRERQYPNFPHLTTNYDIQQLDALLNILWDTTKNMVGNDDDKHYDLLMYINDHLDTATEMAYC